MGAEHPISLTSREDVPFSYERCRMPRGFLKDSHGGPPMTNDHTSTYQKIRYPHWQKLREHVDAAEAAMFQRSQALVESANGHVEQQAIADAIRTLRTIQREKLGYPEGNKNNS